MFVFFHVQSILFVLFLQRLLLLLDLYSLSLALSLLQQHILRLQLLLQLLAALLLFSK